MIWRFFLSSIVFSQVVKCQTDSNFPNSNQDLGEILNDASLNIFSERAKEQNSPTNLRFDENNDLLQRLSEYMNYHDGFKKENDRINISDIINLRKFENSSKIPKEQLSYFPFKEVLSNLNSTNDFRYNPYGIKVFETPEAKSFSASFQVLPSKKNESPDSSVIDEEISTVRNFSNLLSDNNDPRSKLENFASEVFYSSEDEETSDLSNQQPKTVKGDLPLSVLSSADVDGIQYITTNRSNKPDDHINIITDKLTENNGTNTATESDALKGAEGKQKVTILKKITLREMSTKEEDNQVIENSQPHEAAENESSQRGPSVQPRTEVEGETIVLVEGTHIPGKNYGPEEDLFGYHASSYPNDNSPQLQVKNQFKTAKSQNVLPPKLPPYNNHGNGFSRQYFFNKPNMALKSSSSHRYADNDYSRLRGTKNSKAHQNSGGPLNGHEYIAVTLQPIESKSYATNNDFKGVSHSGGNGDNEKYLIPVTEADPKQLYMNPKNGQLIRVVYEDDDGEAKGHSINENNEYYNNFNSKHTQENQDPVHDLSNIQIKFIRPINAKQQNGIYNDNTNNNEVDYNRINGGGDFSNHNEHGISSDSNSGIYSNQNVGKQNGIIDSSSINGNHQTGIDIHSHILRNGKEYIILCDKLKEQINNQHSSQKGLQPEYTSPQGGNTYESNGQTHQSFKGPTFDSVHTNGNGKGINFQAQHVNEGANLSGKKFTQTNNDFKGGNVGPQFGHGNFQGINNNIGNGLKPSFETNGYDNSVKGNGGNLGNYPTSQKPQSEINSSPQFPVKGGNAGNFHNNKQNFQHVMFNKPQNNFKGSQYQSPPAQLQNKGSNFGGIRNNENYKTSLQSMFGFNNGNHPMQMIHQNNGNYHLQQQQNGNAKGSDFSGQQFKGNGFKPQNGYNVIRQNGERGLGKGGYNQQQLQIHLIEGGNVIGHNGGGSFNQHATPVTLNHHGGVTSMKGSPFGNNGGNSKNAEYVLMESGGPSANSPGGYNGGGNKQMHYYPINNNMHPFQQELMNQHHMSEPEEYILVEVDANSLNSNGQYYHIPLGNNQNIQNTHEQRHGPYDSVNGKSPYLAKQSKVRVVVDGGKDRTYPIRNLANTGFHMARAVLPYLHTPREKSVKGNISFGMQITNGVPQHQLQSRRDIGNNPVKHKKL